MFADLSRREVHDGENLPADQFCPCVVWGQLRQRLLRAKFGTEVDQEDVRLVSPFGEWLHVDHPAHPNVELLEVLGRCRMSTHAVGPPCFSRYRSSTNPLGNDWLPSNVRFVRSE